jgi:Rrf2 family protein
MKLSEGVEWSIHCCAVLGLLPAGVTIPGHRLAEYHDVPAPYLVKQLQKLSQAGIVVSTTGRNGGYRLARDHRNITLLEVVLALEGDGPAFRCTEIRRKGPSRIPGLIYPKPCGIAQAMARAEAAWRSELAATTIADMNAEAAQSIDPRQFAKALTWFEEVLA